MAASPHSDSSIRCRNALVPRYKSPVTETVVRPICLATAGTDSPFRYRNSSAVRWSPGSPASAIARSASCSARSILWLGLELLGGCQQRLQPGRRLIQGRLERVRPELPSPALASEDRELLRQDRPQPGLELAVGPAPETLEILVGLEKGLLHNIGGIQRAAQLRIKVQPGQDTQVLTVLLQRSRQTVSGGRHKTP